jgi:ABC-type branched-subunit amino acid transport system substrate-binding protein
LAKARILAVLLMAVGLLQACAPSGPAVQPGLRGPVAPPVAAGPQRIRIGLMLPLSGRQASLGRALAQAAQAAFIETGSERVELIQRDSAGTPEGATRAAAELAADNVAIVVGPLLAAEVRAAAPSLRVAGIPMVSLSSDRGAAEPGVFVTGLLPEDQVRAGFSFVRTAGAQRVAVLGADDASGRAFADAARLVGSELAIDVTRVGLYPPSADPSGALAQVMRTDAPQRGQPAPAPGPSFDTLLLTDAGQRLRVLGEAFATAGVDPGTLRLLGPSLWAAEPLLLSEPALAGALFPAPDEQAWDALATRLALAFGPRPPRLSLIAYDAMALAVQAARRAPVRPVPVDILLAPEGFTGATGRIRLLPDGRSQREMRLYQAAPGGLRNLGPAPFDAPVAGLALAARRG